MNISEIIETSQVIIIDNDKNIYLEDNEKFECIAFYGGKKEGDEEPSKTAIRELNEELGINIAENELTFLEEEIDELRQGVFKSTLYLLEINRSLNRIIEESPRTIKTNIIDFDFLDKNIMIDRDNFKRKLFLALSRSGKV